MKSMAAALALAAVALLGGLCSVDAFGIAPSRVTQRSLHRTARVHMADQDSGGESARRVGVPATPELAAVAARKDVKRQSEERRPLIKINVSVRRARRVLPSATCAARMFLIARSALRVCRA